MFCFVSIFSPEALPSTPIAFTIKDSEDLYQSSPWYRESKCFFARNDPEDHLSCFFTQEETEAQRGSVARPQLHNRDHTVQWRAWGTGFLSHLCDGCLHNGMGHLSTPSPHQSHGADNQPFLLGGCPGSPTSVEHMWWKRSRMRHAVVAERCLNT